MFTGIIEATAPVLKNSGSRLIIDKPASFDDLAIGASISVSGVCLTIVEMDDHSVTFDVVPETLSRTTLGERKKGERVNLERAMKAGARLDGHIVQGHVETVGRIDNVQLTIKNGGTLIVHCPLSIVHSIIPKGSIAIDGVSLTIASIDHDTITIALVPHTLKNTTLGMLKEGDNVNIETDMMLRR